MIQLNKSVNIKVCIHNEVFRKIKKIFLFSSCMYTYYKTACRRTDVRSGCGHMKSERKEEEGKRERNKEQ